MHLDRAGHRRGGNTDMSWRVDHKNGMQTKRRRKSEKPSGIIYERGFSCVEL